MGSDTTVRTWGVPQTAFPWHDLAKCGPCQDVGVRQEALLFGGVVLVGIAVLVGLGWRTTNRQGVLDEAARLQSLYVALASYESQFDGLPAPSIGMAAPFVRSRNDFQSGADPYRSAVGPYPIDGGLPEAVAGEFRISDAYLWAHRIAKKMRTPEWQAARQDPTLGVLATEWLGQVTRTGSFRAQVSGLVLRVNTDGAVVRVQRGGPKALGDVEDLFRRKPERSQ